MGAITENHPGGPRRGPLFVCIAGGSCSGKSTVARLAAEKLGGMMPRGRSTAIISLDAYYRDLSDLSASEKASSNFDLPEAIDIDLALAHLEALSRGEDVSVPLYDFASHTRMPSDEWDIMAAGGLGVVIVEGLFALNFETLRRMAEFSFFIEVDHDTSLERRIKRDVSERGRTRESVIRQYSDMTGPMYDIHVLPLKALADMILDGVLPPAESAAVVAAQIKKISSIFEKDPE